MREQWKKHPKWDIEVSNLGRVRMLDGRVKVLGVDSHGYLKTRVGPTVRRVHLLVLETFRGPCPDGKQCRHLDGDKLNSQLSNLKWGIPREQVADRIKHGTMRNPPVLMGTDNPAAKFDDFTIERARYLMDRGWSTKAVSGATGVSTRHLRRVRLGGRA